MASSPGTVGGQYVSGGGSDPYVFSLTGFSDPICFLMGTNILLADGSEKPVQLIKPGDQVWTPKGPSSVIWAGFHRVGQVSHPAKTFERSLPILFKAGCLDENVPSVDVYVSPSHSIYVDGRHTYAFALINDISIYQIPKAEAPETLNYFHLELEKESLLSTSSMLSASYIEDSNRHMFDNYYSYITAHPFKPHVGRLRYTGNRNIINRIGHINRLKRAINIAPHS